MTDDITLVPGGGFDSVVRLTFGELTYRYKPRFLSRTAMRAHRTAVDTYFAFERSESESRGASERLSDREADRVREKRLRLMCDVIGTLLAADSDETPEPGDALYDGWARRDEVSEGQIATLFAQLMGLDLDDEEEGESPS